MIWRPLLSTLVSTLAILSFLASSSAAVVIYSEPLQGDLPDDFISAPLLPVITGENIVIVVTESGATDTFEVVLDSEPAKDLFLNIQSADTSEVIITAPSHAGTPEEVVRTYNINVPTPGPISLRDITPTSGPPLEDLTAGIHGMQLMALSDISATITYIVIPEPCTLALLACSALSLVFRRQK